MCPTCRKPYYQSTSNTTTLGSTVWTYCQCGMSMFPGTITWSNGTTSTGWIGLKKPVPDVPQAFQDAFSEGELEL